MNKEQRLPYLILTEVELGENGWGNPVMCSFCKYALWQGSCCDESYAECEHPILEVREVCSERFTSCDGRGVDCWGFRPLYAREDCVDMVGIWLQGQVVALYSVPKLGKGGE